MIMIIIINKDICTPVEFRGDLWQQKTRVPGLSCGVILRLSFFVEQRLVPDEQTRT